MSNTTIITYTCPKCGESENASDKYVEVNGAPRCHRCRTTKVPQP